MEFVNERFLDAVFELIIVRMARELPVVEDPQTFLPAWLCDNRPHMPSTRLVLRRFRHPSPYSELDGRWGETFKNSVKHYRFSSMALYFPKPGQSRVFGMCRRYMMFQLNGYHLMIPLLQEVNFEPLAKHFLLDLHCLDAEQIYMDDRRDCFEDFDENPAALDRLYNKLDRLHFTPNPLISFVNIKPTLPYVSEVLNRLARRQCDTEVVNSPEILDYLTHNQRKIVETYGKTLSVAIGSVGEIYKALEIDSFSEFRFRKAKSEHFSCEGFVERVKTSLKKRSSKKPVSIVIEDISLAADLFGSAEEGVVTIDQGVSLTIKHREVKHKPTTPPFNINDL